jgi:hypothetical protein
MGDPIFRDNFGHHAPGLLLANSLENILPTFTVFDSLTVAFSFTRCLTRLALKDSIPEVTQQCRNIFSNFQVVVCAILPPFTS